ncbi:MAG: hypothetical protein RIR46_933, partial [Actinomycetota bacterium]
REEERHSSDAQKKNTENDVKDFFDSLDPMTRHE